MCDPKQCYNHANIKDWEGIVVAIREQDYAIIVKLEKERPSGGNATISGNFKVMPGYIHNEGTSHHQALCDEACTIELSEEEITGRVRVLRDI